MKRIRFIFLILLAFSSFTLQAQKSKKKKNPDSTKVKTEEKFVPPVIQEVKEQEEIIQIGKIDQEGVKETEVVSAPMVDMVRNDRKIFDSKGLFFLESVQSGTSYYDRKYGITDTKGKIVLPTVFNQITLQDDQTVMVRLGRMYALFDENFKTILPFEYASIQKVEGTGYFLVSPATNSYNSLLIDKTGKNILPEEYTNPSLFYYSAQNQESKTKRYIRFNNAKTYKYGIYDLIANKTIVPAEYDEIYDSESGLLVKKSNMMNILDANFKPVLSKWVPSITSTGRGLSIINDNGVYGLCNRNGEFAAKPEFSKITYIYGSVPLFILNKKGAAGIIDAQGKYIFPMIYQEIQSINEGILLVKKNNKWGVMNILGSEVLPAKYDTILYTYNNLFLKGKTITIYNLRNGNVTSETEYNGIENIGGDYGFKVSKNGKYGVLNASLNLFIPVEFDEIIGKYGSDYVYQVKKEEKFGLYNKQGKLLIAPKYDKMFQLSSGMGYMVRLGDKYGLINSYGDEITHCEYDYIGNDYNDETTFICVKGTEVKKVKMYKKY